MMFARLLASLLLLLPLAAAAQTAEPRLGVDYEVLPTPQPTYGQGKIEVAEVFAYTCIHCANLQPQVNVWKTKLGADVRFQYVPIVGGGVSDNFARTYFAAEAMGALDKIHDAMFKAVHIDRRFRNGSMEEIADVVATFGVDRATFLSTANSFAVNAKLNRAKQFTIRTGAHVTPTLVVAGKYRATATRDRGAPGLFATVEWLIAKERAAIAAAAAASKPASNG